MYNESFTPNLHLNKYLQTIPIDKRDGVEYRIKECLKYMQDGMNSEDLPSIRFKNFFTLEVGPGRVYRYHSNKTDFRYGGNRIDYGDLYKSYEKNHGNRLNKFLRKLENRKKNYNDESNKESN